jgi:hypothetical protein
MSVKLLNQFVLNARIIINFFFFKFTSAKKKFSPKCDS